MSISSTQYTSFSWIGFISTSGRASCLIYLYFKLGEANLWNTRQMAENNPFYDNIVKSYFANNRPLTKTLNFNDDNYKDNK